MTKSTSDTIKSFLNDSRKAYINTKGSTALAPLRSEKHPACEKNWLGSFLQVASLELAYDIPVKSSQMNLHQQKS